MHGFNNTYANFHGSINEVSVWSDGLTHEQIQLVMNNGINDIVVVVGKLGNKIIDFFKKYYPEINATFVTNDIYDKSNSLSNKIKLEEFKRNRK